MRARFAGSGGYVCIRLTVGQVEAFRGEVRKMKTVKR